MITNLYLWIVGREDITMRVHYTCGLIWFQSMSIICLSSTRGWILVYRICPIRGWVSVYGLIRGWVSVILITYCLAYISSSGDILDWWWVDECSNRYHINLSIFKRWGEEDKEERAGREKGEVEKWEMG